MKKKIRYIVAILAVTSCISGCSAKKQHDFLPSQSGPDSNDVTIEEPPELPPTIEDTISPQEITIELDLNSELQEVEDRALEIQNELQNAVTQSDINTISAKEYKLWDDELNSLWSRFCDNASETLKASVLEEQKTWINCKTAKIEFAGAPFEDGSIQPLIENDKATALTRVRCYQLAGYLADITNQKFTLDPPSLECLNFVDRQGTSDIYSELTMKETDGMDYVTSIIIYRLAFLEGNAVLEDACTYEFEDVSFGVRGIIRITDDNSQAIFEVTESNWENMKPGEVYTFSERMPTNSSAFTD